ncbi:MAG: hypothetical protein IJS28_04530 [Synergistaceae bacterium]|nr:hypothetical protein [Synergistaceae bacterium]
MIYTYTFAHKNIAVDSLYPEVHKYCAAYRTDKEPDFTVSITQSDIDYERTKSGSEGYSDSWLEISAVHRKIAERMPFFSTILIHGSALSVDGEAYMFTAPSGTGKSTHAGLWRELLGGRVVMVNDDKPLIHIDDEAVVFGTPFCGKERLGTNIAVPLKAICILGRSEENHIAVITAREAYAEIFRQTYRPGDRAAFTRTLELIDRLGQIVKFYRLGCNMNLEAAELAYTAMKETA